MALVFCDGFDWYQGGISSTTFSGDLGKRWTGSTSGNAVMTVSAGAARSPSGQGLSITSASTGFMYKSFGVNYTQGLLGLAVYFPSGSLASRGLFHVLDGTTEQISIRTTASSVLTVTRSGTAIATGSTVLSTGVWYYIELKFTINASTGVVELHLNGATEIASTGSLNTRTTANTQWNGVGVQTQMGIPCWLDDLYVLDTSTGSNTTFLGPVTVKLLYPAANGNYAQWTPNGGSNMGSVSEPHEDGDTSFNQSSTANQIDTFVMQDLPDASGSVFALAHHMVARQDAGAARTIAPLLRIAGTDYAGTADSLSSTYQMLPQYYDVSPATSSAWTVSEVNGLESGYKEIS